MYRKWVIYIILFSIAFSLSAIEVFAAEEEESIELLYSNPADGDEDIRTYQLRCSLIFSKNVAYAQVGRDRAFIEENKSLISLRRADGKPVEKYGVTVGYGHDERQVIYLFPNEWLSPLTKYQIVVAPGIQAANGEDVTTEEYVIEFTTDPYCENGLTIFQNIGIIVGVSVLALGIVVQLIRRKLSRR